MHDPSIPAPSGANGQRVESAVAAVGDGVARELKNFFKDIEDLVQAATSLSGDDLARAKAQLGERISAAKASVERMSGAVADGARRGVTATDDFVHREPWQAVGIGAGVGLLVGVVLARR